MPTVALLSMHREDLSNLCIFLPFPACLDDCHSTPPERLWIRQTSGLKNARPLPERVGTTGWEALSARHPVGFLTLALSTARPCE
ncbi:hypothetical protein AY555_10885 (plasmid) [Haematospirillum jordaniae]|uniref:Uncharacterized protein n=1 Tax=Haematospirillum jordaniae TaxID=1549855 RepID=A0A145VR31_9PROT|nr:hypothetical protein AY555_10885 [Haematospirillum jordaniae]